MIAIEDDVAIQTGAYVQTTRWSGQNLLVGPIHLESGCKIGMRAAVANNVTVGRGSWITPFTPILRDVGAQEIWEGAPARLTGRCTELRAHGERLPVRVIRSGCWRPATSLCRSSCSAALSVVPTAAILWFARGFTPVADAELYPAITSV